METDKSRPFVLYVAEIIYQKIYEIKIKNPNLTNIQAFEIFIHQMIIMKLVQEIFMINGLKNLRAMTT